LWHAEKEHHGFLPMELPMGDKVCIGMGTMRCSRCGREPVPEELTSIGQLVSSVPITADTGESPLGAGGPWASIDGETVCPTCQTATEVEDVAGRIVEAVEAEVERARREDADPAAHEAALIAYAMSLRERAKLPPPPR
jgi:rubredoxin